VKPAKAQAAAKAIGFPPVEPRQARVLILGSLPSVESIRRGQYYAHPRNAFWPIMGELVGAGRGLEYPTRLRKLAGAGIMLWDVLHAAHRPGSLDSAIHPRGRVANDIPALLVRHPELQTIIFNGAPAEVLFHRHVAKKCGHLLKRVELIRLPSTSPACASRTFARKLTEWKAAILSPS
jgi:hypoxanthine-DNA glycosylase